MSLAGMFELYLERSDLRPASVRFKRRAFRYFVEWFGDMPPADVTIAIAEDYRTRLAKGRSKRAANGYLANLKPFFKWLARHGQITQNPFSLIAPYRIAESKRATFKAAELSRLLQAASRLWRTAGPTVYRSTTISLPCFRNSPTRMKSNRFLNAPLHNHPARDSIRHRIWYNTVNIGLKRRITSCLNSTRTSKR